MRTDPEDPTSVSDVDDSDPELPIAEEANVTWNRKNRKSGKETNPNDVHG